VLRPFRFLVTSSVCLLMNPDKLFDYLDGKLAPADRTQLEEKLMSDAQLRQQFNIAREIHRSAGGSREVIVPDENPANVQRSAILTKRIVTACAALVFLNVLIGIGVIVGKNKKKTDYTAKEAGIRQQLSASLGAAAQNALPAPSFVAQEIHLTAPRAEWENVASRMMVVVDVPSAREQEFRRAVGAAASISPMPAVGQGAVTAAEPSPNERTILQVRIAEAAR